MLIAYSFRINVVRQVFGDPPFVPVVEVDQDKQDEKYGYNNAIDSEDKDSACKKSQKGHWLQSITTLQAMINYSESAKVLDFVI